jgi:hypothetical protein
MHKECKSKVVLYIRRVKDKQAKGVKAEGVLDKATHKILIGN